MIDIEIPDHVRDAIVRLADERRAAIARSRAAERRAAQRRRAASARRRRRLRPLADKIAAWARAVAMTGVLDPLGDQDLVLYESPVGNLGHRRRIALRANGAFAIETRTIRAGGSWIAADAEGLLEHARDHELRWLLAAIDSGDVWSVLDAP